MEVGTFCEEERGLTAYDGLSEGGSDKNIKPSHEFSIKLLRAKYMRKDTMCTFPFLSQNATL